MDKIKGIATDSIKFWEKGRLIYNLILLLIVIGFAIAGGVKGRSVNYLDIILWTFVFGIGANVLYCSAYVIDLFVQISDFRDTWKRIRWILLMLGIILASIFTCSISKTMFM